MLGSLRCNVSVAGTPCHLALVRDWPDSPAPQSGLNVLKKRERPSRGFKKQGSGTCPGKVVP
jgi:hypothetical protein